MMKTFRMMTVAALLLAAGAVWAEVTPPDEALLKAAKDADGYAPLFSEDLSNATLRKGGWAWEDGALVAKGKGDIWTKERFGDFALDLEFKLEPQTNSGVFIRTDSIRDWLNTAIEVQVLQPNDQYDNVRHHCGGIFDCLAPAKLAVKAPGEWNRFLIIAKGAWIWVYLNDELVTGMDLDQWTEAGKNPDGTPNKFKYAYKDMAREGFVGLQYHGDPVAYRNMKIKPLK